MRLVDADKLKIAIMTKDNANEETWEQLYDSVLEEIDNAPTVSERPQGEWIKMSDIYGSYYSCNQCGYDRIEQTSNFCPNCGARMKGDGQ